jgi:type VI secretion system secreted protein VgrG
MLKSLAATEQRGGEDAANTGSGNNTIGGGAGTVVAWGRPDLVTAAPGGIASFTPASSVYSAGNTLSLVATQDLQLMSQANHALAAKDGLVLYTYGKAADPNKPNTETGIQLHAASGSVSVQSQSAGTKLTADKSVEFGSTSGMVKITAPKSILMTAAGAAIDVQAGGITLKGPGKVEFRASMKNLTGPGSASEAVVLKKPAALEDCPWRQS